MSRFSDLRTFKCAACNATLSADDHERDPMPVLRYDRRRTRAWTNAGRLIPGQPPTARFYQRCFAAPAAQSEWLLGLPPFNPPILPARVRIQDAVVLLDCCGYPKWLSSRQAWLEVDGSLQVFDLGTGALQARWP